MSGKNGWNFALVDDIFMDIFMTESVCILIEILWKLFPEGPINIMSALVQVMPWCQTGTKPLPEAMTTQFFDEYMCHQISMC